MQQKGGAQKPDLYSYFDYREYLKDLFAHLKSLKTGFTVMKLSKDAGLSGGYLNMVLAGKIKLSESAYLKLIPHLDLQPPEQNFLRLLRIVADGESQEERLSAIEQLQKHRGFQRLNPEEVKTFQYMSHWHYIAIREMASLKGFRLDPLWIQKRLSFQVSLPEINEAINFLMTHRYLEADRDGKIVPPQQRLQCNEHIYKAALTQYHRQFFELAAQSIDEVEKEERNLLGHTIAFSQSRFAEIKKIFEDAMEKAIQLAQSETNKDVVYHMLVSQFPVTLSDKTKRVKASSE
jgi:uncharacterized protein (TIGR02147 family)